MESGGVEAYRGGELGSSTTGERGPRIRKKIKRTGNGRFLGRESELDFYEKKGMK